MKKMHEVIWVEDRNGAWRCTIRDEIGMLLAEARGILEPNELVTEYLCYQEEIHTSTLKKPVVVPWMPGVDHTKN